MRTTGGKWGVGFGVGGAGTVRGASGSGGRFD